MKMLFLLSFLFSLSALANHKDGNRDFDLNVMIMVTSAAGEELSSAVEAIQDLNLQTGSKKQFCRRISLSVNAYWDAIKLLGTQAPLELLPERYYGQALSAVNIKEQYSFIVNHLDDVGTTYDLGRLIDYCEDRSTSSVASENIDVIALKHMSRFVANLEEAARLINSFLVQF